jgi:type IV pilus assembly protein PilM
MAKTVSIDIGSKTIKIVEGTSDKKNLSVKRAVKVNTPLNAIQEGYIKDYESIRNILRQTLTQTESKQKMQYLILIPRL